MKQTLMGPSVSSFQTAVDDVDIVDKIEFVLGLVVATPVFAIPWLGAVPPLMLPLTTEAHEEDEGDPTSFLLSFDLSDCIGLAADLFFSFIARFQSVTLGLYCPPTERAFGVVL